MTKVGSRPAAARTEAVRLVVVVLPCVAGDGDAVFEAHEFGQHQGAGDDGYLLREGGGHFGVVFF